MHHSTGTNLCWQCSQALGNLGTEKYLFIYRSAIVTSDAWAGQDGHLVLHCLQTGAGYHLLFIKSFFIIWPLFVIENKDIWYTFKLVCGKIQPVRLVLIIL